MQIQSIKGLTSLVLLWCFQPSVSVRGILWQSVLIIKDTSSAARGLQPCQPISRIVNISGAIVSQEGNETKYWFLREVCFFFPNSSQVKMNRDFCECHCRWTQLQWLLKFILEYSAFRNIDNNPWVCKFWPYSIKIIFLFFC